MIRRLTPDDGAMLRTGLGLLGAVWPLLALALILPAPAAEAKDAPRVLKPAVLNGRIFVQRHCAGCHNAASSGRSVYAPAPPLRELGGRYTPLQLQDVLIDVQAGNHYAMPRTVVSTRDALDIAAYIEALSKSDTKTRRKLGVASCVGTTC